MIRLCVEDYCQDCNGFEPASSTNTLYKEGGREEVVTQVYCRHRQMCAKLVKRYEKEDVKHGQP